MSARQPNRTGYAVNAGIRLYYEVHGTGPLTVLLVPPWPIVTGALWKMQVPFLARHYTTVVYDPRGNGRSDRPASGYELDDVVSDALAVLDELNIDRCAVLSISAGMRSSCVLAARHPERVSALAAVAGYYYSSAGPPTLEEAQARNKRTLEHFDERVRLFWAARFPEPHSTKAQDDGWEWSHQTDATTVAAANEALWRNDARDTVPQIRCPVLQIHGFEGDDHVQALWGHQRFARSTLVTIVTPGHCPNVRDPVKVNLILREFFDGVIVEDRATPVREQASARARA